MERVRESFVGDKGGDNVAEEEGKGITLTLTLTFNDSNGPLEVAFSREIVHVGGDFGAPEETGMALGPFGVLGIGIGEDLDSPLPMPTPTSEPKANMDENLPRARFVGFSVVADKDFRFWEVPVERV